MINFIEYYKHKGHIFGECLSHQNTNLMYINIPKNASSWTKPNLKDWGWEHYNYHFDNLYHKHALVVIRDPLDRWISGIAEYFYLYHNNIDVNHLGKSYFDLIFDRIAFDDHTEKQVLFIEKLEPTNCTFFYCDQSYRENFSHYLNTCDMPNRYFKYEYQHVSNNDFLRNRFKNFFTELLDQNQLYKDKVKDYYIDDYRLIERVYFYNKWTS